MPHQESVRRQESESEASSDRQQIRVWNVGTGSWTAIPELKTFSGTAWYEAEFDLRDLAGRYELDLGDIREIAEVELNGEPLGVRLWPPYHFNATPALKPGGNRLRIGVTNTRANELTDNTLLSGMLRPVRLVRSD